ncbi:hypothetical protein D6779_01255 [Candidatus Parcubacteria bacterium]|nr:MAG: hypothetical protein D6779_01255 [Candidatus Parcubacteria bacterium]
MREIMDIYDISKEFGISPKSIQKKIAQGLFPRGTRVAGFRRNLWIRSEVEAWVKTQIQNARRNGRPRQK